MDRRWMDVCRFHGYPIIMVYIGESVWGRFGVCQAGSTGVTTLGSLWCCFGVLLVFLWHGIGLNYVWGEFGRNLLGLLEGIRNCSKNNLGIQELPVRRSQLPRVRLQPKLLYVGLERIGFGIWGASRDPSLKIIRKGESHKLCTYILIDISLENSNIHFPRNRSLHLYDSQGPWRPNPLFLNSTRLLIVNQTAAAIF